MGESGTFLAQADGAAYTYDPNGNMVRRGGAAGSTAQRLTWDIENRPTSIVSGAVTTTFGYDAKGARVSKSVSGGNTTHYVNRYYEVNVTTGEATKYYYLGDRLIGMKKGAGAVQYVLQDHLGSTAVTADGSTSTSLRYVPYGATQSESGSAPTDRKFTGQPLDASTGLYWYQSRLYDTSLGRFASADSIPLKVGDKQALNRYTYGLNNPFKFIDPTGQDVDDWFDDSWQEEFQQNHDGAKPELPDYAFRFFTMAAASGMVPDIVGSGTEADPFPLPPDNDLVKNRDLLKKNLGVVSDYRDRLAVLRLGVPGPGPGDYLVFGWRVGTGGVWDYKNEYGTKYEAFGNFHYGLMGSAWGFPEGTLLLGAGAAQRWSDIGGQLFGGRQPNPSARGDPWAGPPFGDDPRDQANIQFGIDVYRAYARYGGRW